MEFLLDLFQGRAVHFNGGQQSGAQPLARESDPACKAVSASLQGSPQM